MAHKNEIEKLQKRYDKAFNEWHDETIDLQFNCTCESVVAEAYERMETIDIAIMLNEKFNK